MHASTFRDVQVENDSGRSPLSTEGGKPDERNCAAGAQATSASAAAAQ
jgi:hypothetical protein